MNIFVPAEPSELLETQSKVEVLQALEPAVEEMMEGHLRKRRMWMPSDFLPADEQTAEDQLQVLTRLRERARSIADSIRVSLALNLLTEEGLPHFHRLLDRYLGEGSVWQRWNFLWTAEEDRHGCVLRDYVRDARLFRWREVEMMQFAYQEAGFTPSWDRDPYRVFVYTTLQERATQFAHRNTAKLVEDEPVLKGITTHVAADEARHFNFYRNVFKAILEMDPGRALESALAIMPAIDMPGHAMPSFREMADVVRRMGIYTPWDYKKIVEEAIAFWRIDVLTGLGEIGRKAQEKIMAIPERLQKVAEYVERRTQRKSFSFDFIYNRILSLD